MAQIHSEESVNLLPTKQYPPADANGPLTSYQLECFVSKQADLAQAFDAEVKRRKLQEAELDARLQCEISNMNNIVDQRTLNCQKVLHERIARLEARVDREVTEFSATVKAMWQQGDSQGEGSRATSDIEEHDINTVYGMAQEALGDTIRLSQEIAEERERRGQQLAELRTFSENVEHRLNTMQNILRSFSAGVPQTAAGQGQERQLAERGTLDMQILYEELNAVMMVNDSLYTENSDLKRRVDAIEGEDMGLGAEAIPTSFEEEVARSCCPPSLRREFAQSTDPSRCDTTSGDGTVPTPRTDLPKIGGSISIPFLETSEAYTIMFS